MKSMPDKGSSNQKKRRHSGTKIYRRTISLIFTLVVIAVTILVYSAFKHGIGLPSSNVGRIDPNMQLSANQPSDAQDSFDIIGTTAPLTSTDLTEPSEDAEPEEETKEPLDPQELAEQYLENMTLEEMVWQMMFVTMDELTGIDGAQYPAGGVYFRADDLTDQATLEDDIFALQAQASIPLMLGVTEEGGSIAPLSAIGLVDSISSMRTYGDAGDADALYQVGKKLGEQISAAGIHFNLAPVADSYNWYPADSYDLQNRTFGKNDSITSGTMQKMVAQMIKGMQEGGTIACMKHFPNLASTAQSEVGDFSWQSYEKFSSMDFKSYAAGIEAGVEMILVSNMYAPNLTNGAYVPCFRAKEVVTDILRTELGFDGVIITDDQSNVTDMAGIVEAVMAGCDVIYLPSDPKAAVDVILEAVNTGALSQERIEQSVYRILLLKCEYGIITE